MPRITKQDQINTARELNQFLRNENEVLKADKKKLFESVELRKLEIARDISRAMADTVEGLSKLVLSVNNHL